MINDSDMIEVKHLVNQIKKCTTNSAVSVTAERIEQILETLPTVSGKTFTLTIHSPSIAMGHINYDDVLAYEMLPDRVLYVIGSGYEKFVLLEPKSIVTIAASEA